MNAGGKVVAQERGVVHANQWFPEISGELAEEVIGLGRYGKTLTVLGVKGLNGRKGYYLGTDDIPQR